MRAQFRYLRRLIYALKRAYGQTIVLCRDSNASVDPRTGVATSTLSKQTVRRAILLPITAFRTFAYDLSFIAANKNFTWGGTFDVNDRVCIVSMRDARGFTFDNNTWVSIRSKRFEAQKVTTFDEQEVVAFILHGIVDARPLDQFSEDATEDLGLTEEHGEPS